VQLLFEQNALHQSSFYLAKQSFLNQLPFQIKSSDTSKTLTVSI